MSKINMRLKIQDYFKADAPDLKETLVTTQLGTGMFVAGAILNVAAFAMHNNLIGASLCIGGVVASTAGFGLVASSSIKYAISQDKKEKLNHSNKELSK